MTEYTTYSSSDDDNEYEYRYRHHHHHQQQQQQMSFYSVPADEIYIVQVDEPEVTTIHPSAPTSMMDREYVHPPPYANASIISSSSSGNDQNQFLSTLHDLPEPIPSPTTTDPDMDSMVIVSEDSNIAVAAGTASAIIGWLIGGTFFAAIAGFSSAYATQKEGATGDIARAVGELALVARIKFRRLDQKHQLVDKAKQTAAAAWEKAKELDHRHHILDQAKAVMIYSWHSIAQFVVKNRLLERGVDAMGQGMEYLGTRVLTPPPPSQGPNTSQSLRNTTTPARLH